MTELTCEWCGGQLTRPSTCPKSLPCPSCDAPPGSPCKRPSGHRANQLHTVRIRLAEQHDHRQALAP